MPVKFYKSLMIMNGQYPTKRLWRRGKKLHWSFWLRNTFSLCVFFYQGSRVLQIHMVFVIKNSFLWPTPKKHKNISCIFMTLFIPIFLSETPFPCLHGKLLFVLQSPVQSIAPFSHSFIKNRIYSVSGIFSRQWRYNTVQDLVTGLTVLTFYLGSQTVNKEAN